LQAAEAAAMVPDPAEHLSVRQPSVR